MRRFIFEESVLDDFSLWAVYDKRVFQKILKLLKEISRSPFEGFGKPEQLKYGKSGCWSRRINEEHRLVYKINDEGNILIISCRGHYE
jgi:toxin YoeB